MIPVYFSRHTLGLDNGDCVSFRIGDTVTYRLESGKEIEIVIESERMRHPQLSDDKTGYEAKFLDTGEMAFAVAEQIIKWEGKC